MGIVSLGMSTYLTLLVSAVTNKSIVKYLVLRNLKFNTVCIEITMLHLLSIIPTLNIEIKT